MKNLKYLVLLLISFAFITGCDDDPEEEVSPYVGNYVITKASLAETLTLSILPNGQIPVPENTDITQAIQTALLGSVNCASADKSYIELRKDYSMYLSCEGANPMNAGTWEELSAQSLKLNMNNAAIPSSPTGFVLTVTEVNLSNTLLSGKTTVPMPKAMLAAMVAQISGGLATLDDANTPEALPVVFAIELTKK